MTKPIITLAQANANLARIENDLDSAQQELDYFERLTSAKDRLAKLIVAQAQATKERDAAFAADEKARDEARFTGLSDLRVIEVGKPEEGVLSSAFSISYTRIAYDTDSGQNVAQPVTVYSFGALPTNVLALLIERHPDRIPAKIMALAPNNPKEAFSRYFLGFTRGYIAG